MLDLYGYIYRHECLPNTRQWPACIANLVIFATHSRVWLKSHTLWGMADKHVIAHGVGAAAGAKNQPSIMDSLKNECLKNPFTWLFAISYFFVYVVRTGVTAWFIHFLIQVGHPSLPAVCLGNCNSGLQPV